LEIQLGLAKKFPAKIEAIVSSSKDLIANASSMGSDPKIAICLTGAGEMLGKASGSFKANVNVSASVTASAKGEASGSAGGEAKGG
jgi:hypothetical protein